jgi:hypothetical protein
MIHRRQGATKARFDAKEGVNIPLKGIFEVKRL